MAKNCSILSQKVPKFKQYKHNDELFNIYYVIFYELWTFAYFDRLCKLEKRGMKLKKIFSSETTEPVSTKLCWDDPWLVPFQNGVHQSRPVSKMTAITKNRNFFKWPKLLSILSQNVPKFELYKHKLFNIYYGIFYESSPLKLLSQSQPNFAEMILGWSPSKIVSGISELRQRWPPQPNLI